MYRFELSIVAEDDLILSERSATEGAHRSLDHVPGSALLGVAAARLYRRLSAQDAFIVFHSGRVRFGNAYPVDASGMPTQPMPLCWFRPKGVAFHADGRVTADAVHNLSLGRLPPNQQPQQCRDGYVSAQGGYAKPRLRHTLKTAIDPETGRAADAQLFGYEGICAGTRLRGLLEADADLPSSLLDAVAAAFDGKLRIGRSRSAEFGMARCTVKAMPAVAVDPNPGACDPCFVWLLSDAAFCDAAGMPTSQPDAAALGLPGGEIDWSLSHVRSRRFSAWNAHRGGFERERLLLAKGSVLAWRPGTATATQGQHSAGLYTEAGFGRLWVAPPLLQGLHPVSKNADSAAAVEAAAVVAPAISARSSDLLDWLRGQSESGARASRSGSAVPALQKQVLGWYRAVRSESGLADDVAVGPSSSQWRDVVSCLEALAGKEAAREQVAMNLFDEPAAPCGEKRPGWQDRLWSVGSNRLVTFREAFREAVDKLARDQPDIDLANTLILLARAVSSDLGRRNADRHSTEGSR